MEKRRAILIISAIACMTIALIVGLQIKRAVSASGPMPVYQGRNAREWLDQVFTTNQAAAMAAFRSMGTNAFPVLVRALNDSRWDRLYGSTYSIMPAAIRKRIVVPSSQTTWSAAQLVLINDPRSYAVAPDLTRLLANKNNRARQYILWAIEVRSEAQSKELTPFIVDCLSDSDPHTRSVAAAVLSRVGPLSNDVVKRLAAALHDPSSEVRSVAAVTLGHNRTESRAAAADLKSALNDSSGEVRINAAMALWAIGGEELPIEAIKKTLEAEALKNSGDAIIDLHQLEPDYPGMRAMLMNVFKNDRSMSRPMVALTLSGYGSEAKEAVPGLLDLLEKSRGDPYSKSMYLQALEKIDSEAARKYKEDHPGAGH